MAALNDSDVPKRYLTTNNRQGVSEFVQNITSSPPERILPDGAKIFFCYGSENFPVDLNEAQDLRSYQNLIQNPPGIVIPNGFAFRVIDMPPGYESVMHRTTSVNFNVVIKGKLELKLDGNEIRILKPGDSAIQRAVNHSWKNVSSTDWARIVAVPIPAVPLRFDGYTVEGTGVPGMSA